MEQVLILIADPADPTLSLEAVAAIAAVLESAGSTTARPHWLAPGIACEMAVSGEPTTAMAAARAALRGRRIDCALLPAAGRRKRLLVADMESTVIRNELLDDLAEFVGRRDEIARITERSMNGEIDFRQALRERVAMLAGLSADRLAEACAGITPMPGARTLIATMHAHGAYAALVSGGFRYFTGRVRSLLGFDHDEGNEILIEDGRLTGRVREPILNRDGKRETLERIAAERGLTMADTLAVGDGANDLPMLLAAGLGVGFHAKPSVAAAAPVRIDHGDLTALLYLQGYRREQFASAETMSIDPRRPSMV